MAAIKADKNKTLVALTTAALCLPGLDVSAAVPAAQITGNASYGRYQESDNRMKVDIYHVDATIPLSDRVELAFSLDRDIYSGATPAFSMPKSLTNLPKYKQKSDGTPASELSYVDLVSAASGGVTASGLTILGGLNAFKSFQDYSNAAKAQITASSNEAFTGFIFTRETSFANIAQSLENELGTLTAQVGVEQAALDAALEARKAVYDASKAQQQAEFDATFATEKAAYEANKVQQKAELEASFLATKTQLDTQYFAELGSIDPALPQLALDYNKDVNNLTTQQTAASQDLIAKKALAEQELISSKTAAEQVLVSTKNAALANLDALQAAKQAEYISANPKPAAPDSISGSFTIDFGGTGNTLMTSSSYAGFANNAPIAGGNCAGSGATGCFYQNGMVVGIVEDTSNSTAHLHRTGSSADRKLGYHADSSGIYVRSLDSKAFSLDSMDFFAAISDENPDSGQNDFWEILGYRSALNPGLDKAINNGDWIARLIVPNGFSGTIDRNPLSNTAGLTFSSAFDNIGAFWIHYNGYQKTPSDGKEFGMSLDNIRVSSVVVPTAQQTAWDDALQLYTTNYKLTVYDPGFTQINATFTQNKTQLEAKHNEQKSALEADYNTEALELNRSFDSKKSALDDDYKTKTTELLDNNRDRIAELEASYKAQLDELSNNDSAAKEQLNTFYKAQHDALSASHSNAIETLNATYKSQYEALSIADSASRENLTNTYNAQKSAINASYDTEREKVSATYEAQRAQQQKQDEELTKQSQIAAYAQILNRLIPSGTPAVQRFQIQPQEARSMPQFTAKYFFDSTTLAASGGFSDEPDFLSNFGSINVSHELNDKLTTISGGYGLTSNTITRNGGGHSVNTGEEHDHYGSSNYPALNDESIFHSVNTSIAQVLSKNTLFQSSANFTHQNGYLSNPYKFVYVRGEITPEEYYKLFSDPDNVNWNDITQLEVVGTELFREKRPDQRNIWSFSNRINHYMPQMDATAHLDYRFFIDDWGVNSHTFELKWYQSLPGGLTVTPGIRYYSQSQADFFAPYFLSPRADGNYSSDFRLSAFGDLSGGLTVSKQFARGIKVEAGFEYVTHSGSLKLGGGGVGDYADFDYFLAHANLSVDLSARQMGAGDDHSGHHMHHHGAPVPAGIMFGHMMNKADDIMVGYRFMYSMQDGSMLHGSNKANDQLLISNACKGLSNGCLYKPAEMNMQMHMLDLMYAPTDWLNLMVMPQIMSMDMTMSESLQASGDDSHGGTEHTSSDIGDTVITALVKVADTGNHKVHLGIGMSAPTGSIDAKLSSGTLQNSGSSTQVEPGTAVLQDYGMQLGSGTWDLKPSLTYTGQADEWGWGAQLSGVKRLEKNDHGYAYGDIFQATGWGSYTIFNWLSASVRGVYTWQDQIRGETNQPHDTTATVDYPANYGGKIWDIGLGLNAFIPAGQFAGHSVSVEWLQPVSTDANGYQLDRQGAITASWSFMF